MAVYLYTKDQSVQVAGIFIAFLKKKKKVNIVVIKIRFIFTILQHLIQLKVTFFPA